MERKLEEYYLNILQLKVEIAGRKKGKQENLRIFKSMEHKK
jgi:hypothetical protein